MEEDFINDLANALDTGSTESTTEETQVGTPVENIEQAQAESSQGSSLNNEVEQTSSQQDATPTGGSSTEINDDVVAKYLAERKGITATSLDELAEAYSKRSESTFASDDIEAINRYVRDTGRTVEDYYNTQKVNLEESNPEDLIKAKMMEEKSFLSQKEIDLLYDNKYGKTELKKIDEDLMTDEEILEIKEFNQRAERLNQIKDIEMKESGRDALNHFKNIQEEYKQPVKSNNQGFDVESFRNQSKESFSKLDKLEFGEGDDKFVYEVTDGQRQSANPVTPEEFMGEFIKEDGTFDVAEWNKLVFTKRNLNSMFKASSVRAASAGRESLEKEMKNTDLGVRQQQANEGSSQSSEIDNIIDQIF